MHRTLALTVPPTVTEALQAQLVALDDVIGLSVQRGASQKPVGDVLTVHVVYFVRSTIPGYNGCASYPAGRPGAVVASIASRWTVGHVLDLNHVNNTNQLMTGAGTAGITHLPPDLAGSEVTTMLNSTLSTPL